VRVARALSCAIVREEIESEEEESNRLVADNSVSTLFFSFLKCQ
jgi:hypothetical protein